MKGEPSEEVNKTSPPFQCLQKSEVPIVTPLYQLEALTNDQLQLLVAALQKMLAPLQAKLAAIREELEVRKADLIWDDLLSRPVKKGTAMWDIQERAKFNIAAGHVKELKPGESFEDLFRR